MTDKVVTVLCGVILAGLAVVIVLVVRGIIREYWK